jgi:hypothetical protein
VPWPSACCGSIAGGSEAVTAVGKRWIEPSHARSVKPQHLGTVLPRRACCQPESQIDRTPPGAGGRIGGVSRPPAPSPMLAGAWNERGDRHDQVSDTGDHAVGGVLVRCIWESARICHARGRGRSGWWQERGDARLSSAPANGTQRYRRPWRPNG